MRTVIAIASLVALIGTACGDAGTAGTASVAADMSTTTAPPTGPPTFDPLVHTTPGLHEVAIAVGDAERTYTLRVPTTHDPTNAAALVVAFHGWTATPDQMAKGAWGVLAEEFGFLLAAPAGEARQWAVAHDDVEAAVALPDSGADLAEFPYGDEDVAFASQLIAEIAEYFVVDPGRVFVTGVSLGGFMASRVACELDGIAAIGATYNSVLYSDPCPTEATPAVISVGHENDQTHAVSDAERAVAAWAEHDGCSSDPIESAVRERVVRNDFTGCSTSAAVAMVVNEYSWGGDSAERTIWEFFEALP
jgi:poly(3-hydroxybutyrate) depolymerase